MHTGLRFARARGVNVSWEIYSTVALGVYVCDFMCCDPDTDPEPVMP